MNLFQHRFSPLGLGLLLVPAIVFGQTLRTEPLSSVRDKIVFPELSAAEKRVLVEQAQVFLRDLYVHRYHKPIHYPGNTDPGVAIAKLAKDVDKLSTKDLNLALSRIFCAQRDLHLNFYFPAPYGDYTSLIPMTFARTSGSNNFFEVRISAVNRALFEQFAPGQRVPALGDQVISYDGKSVDVAVKEMLPIAQGANPYGGFSRVLQHMTNRWHRRREVPAANQVKLQLKAYSPNGKGETYSITVPWLAQWTEGAARTMRGKELPLAKRFELGVDEYQREYESFLKANQLEPVSVYPNQPTGEPALTWGVINNTDGNFGYLRLSTFNITATNVDFTISEVRRLLMGELSGTDGVIFDVRSNPGGWISLADKLPQLFSRMDTQVLDFRMLNNQLGWRLANETKMGEYYPPFKKVVNESWGNGKTFTGSAQFTSDLQANMIGQVYYKPVVVMANARSYSATDMFTTSMQDNRIAPILGEDPKTGAGGANVVSHPEYLELGPSDVFKPLPPGYWMNVSFRQTLRFGANAGKLIEDFGCDANADISRTAEDLISGGATQLAKVTSALKQLVSGYKASARGEQSLAELFMSARSENSYEVFVKHTPFVNVYLDGVLRDQIAAQAGENEVKIHYTLPGTLVAGNVARLTFEGVDSKNQVLWNLKRRISLLNEKVVPGSEGVKVDFATTDTTAPLSFVNQGSATELTGWRLAKPYLQVGYSPNYIDNLNSDAILFLDLKGRASATLEFGMECDTEQDWDFVDVFVTNNITKKVLLSASGKRDMARYSFDLSEFAGQDNVAVHFRFTSDTNTNSAGAKLTDIVLR